jgi:hypothetical protein
MKKYLSILVSITFGLGLLSACAQFGPPGGGPQFGGAMGKLFGENQSYTALLEFQTTDNSGDNMVMPGKISFDTGKLRFEMDMTQMKNSRTRPETAARMKQMGMDKMVTISRPDKKITYLIYPGMQSYVENPMTDSQAAPDSSDYKVETTELGKDTVDGHPCVKNKVVVTDKDGNKHESTVWNATDLKNFPVKIENSKEGRNVTMLFKNVSLDKPDAALFEAPPDFTKFDDMQSMMQQMMIKRMGGGMALPPGH